MIDLPTYYPYELRSWYPHMKPADVVIWQRFIEKYPGMYDRVSYDVPVGTPPDFNTVVNPVTGGDAIALYKQKIDVVGFIADQIDIIEVKPQAGTKALGQAAGYAHMYARDFEPAVIPRAVVVTDRLTPDLEYVARKLGVLLIVV